MGVERSGWIIMGVELTDHFQGLKPENRDRLHEKLYDLTNWKNSKLAYINDNYSGNYIYFGFTIGWNSEEDYTGWEPVSINPYEYDQYYREAVLAITEHLGISKKPSLIILTEYK